ncbi:hypothetical protein GCM10007420_08360 [Glycocaulis albus]|uniref:Uncharacterized protein n=1 Tax=Glycocaulis albus TaxID=1382801 RepID=A0ABQ1XJC4_9PROT|nr:hypothetical protein [Glycocaulis albus]GGG95172.1 hypothetical protein GCM10007420_08360 [Glycocaulis albus]
MNPVAKNPKQPPSEPPVCARIKRNIQLDSALQAQAGRDWRRAEQSLVAIEAEIPALRAEVRRLETLSVLPHNPVPPRRPGRLVGVLQEAPGAGAAALASQLGNARSRLAQAERRRSTLQAEISQARNDLSRLERNMENNVAEFHANGCEGRPMNWVRH